MRVLTTILALAAIATPLCRADVIYSYTGNNFIYGDGPYGTSDFLSISVSLNSALPTDSALTGYTATDWTVSDGVMTLTPADENSSLVLEFATEGGVITSWIVQAHAYADLGFIDPFIQSCDLVSISSGLCANNHIGTPDGATFNSAYYAGYTYYGYSYDPGQWTYPTPEPSSLALFAIGGAGVLIRRRFVEWGTGDERAR